MVPINPIKTVVAACLFVCFTLSFPGCSGADAVKSLPAFSQESNQDYYPDSMVSGTLEAEVDPDIVYFYVVDDSDRAIGLHLPEDYGAEVRGDEVVVVDQDGERIASVGETVTGGGAEVQDSLDAWQGPDVDAVFLVAVDSLRTSG